MPPSKPAARSVEFGDFQTPSSLAREACELLRARGVAPASVVEPTCGVGNFLMAALDGFPTLERGLGVEISGEYVGVIRRRLRERSDAARVRIRRESFFNVDWPGVLRHLREPILVVGNPPWVTNSAIGAVGGSNLPRKSNFQGFSGLDALTGKSNFDISEWMLVKLLEALNGRRATLAMLCKRAVARKVLAHAWNNAISLTNAEIHPIDAAAAFGAAVGACLLICHLAPDGQSRDCRVFRRLGDAEPAATIGQRDGQLIADVAAYERWKHLSGEGTHKWRSGVKHDCARVMELRREGGLYRNGFGEVVELEHDQVHPMLKSSEIAGGQAERPTRWMLVPQRFMGEDTSIIHGAAPKTWEYLQRWGHLLDRRASSVYRNRPRFSVFGVGDYTFSPWKVAISGFYKKLQFTVVGPFEGGPVVLDDTSYFLACRNEPEARFVADLLNSEPARAFFSAFVFWDAKRPVTIDLLRRLDLSALAGELGVAAALEQESLPGGQCPSCENHPPARS